MCVVSFLSTQRITLENSKSVYTSARERESENSASSVVKKTSIHDVKSDKSADTRCATDGDPTKIGINCTCCVHSGWPRTYRVETFHVVVWTRHRHQMRSEYSSNSTLLRVSDELFKKAGSSTKCDGACAFRGIPNVRGTAKRTIKINKETG